MKRLDKPTRQTKRDNLLNIKKKTVMSLKILAKSQISKFLVSEISLSCLIVYKLNFQGFIFQVHPKLIGTIMMRVK